MVEETAKKPHLDLAQRITSCKKCPRLVQYLSEVSRDKVKRFRDSPYWGKPVPGFGDQDPKVLFIGLAPAAHGGNRTGRMFTGDRSGNWLIRALYDFGFANKPTSERSMDGLQLKNVFLTATIRCAPPENKPTSIEIKSCSDFLEEELRLMPRIKIVVALGRIAFQAALQLLVLEPKKKFVFRHGAIYRRQDGLVLICSYHPSRQNTQTRRLTWDMWVEVFHTINKELEPT